MSAVSRLLAGLGRAYNRTAQRSPAATGIVTTVIKTSMADLFTQKVIEGRDTVDYKRNAVFTTFGFAYLGVWQYQLYNKAFVAWTPAIQRLAGSKGTAAVLTFLDQCIHHPILYFPSFYMLKGAMEGRDLSSSLARCQEDLWPNLKALWAVWVPAQLINFGVVPVHLRIPFVAAVSFGWTVILSVMRGAMETVHAVDASATHALEHAVHGAMETVHTVEDAAHVYAVSTSQAIESAVSRGMECTHTAEHAAHMSQALGAVVHGVMEHVHPVEHVGSVECAASTPMAAE